MEETRLRSLLKAISWRLLGTITTILIIYLFFGKLKLATIAGLFEFTTKIILYFVHERIWNRIPFGKR